MSALEQKRSRVQESLDDQKTQLERNQLGQFATPGALASDILASAREYVGDRTLRFLDPAFGTGSFYSALLQTFPRDQIGDARGFEVDRHYGEPAQELWCGTGLTLSIEDFTLANPPGEKEALADLIVCNPPYVRHHHLERTTKGRLAALVESDLGIRVSGLAGLYVYFMLLSHRWLRHNSLSIWLVPSEFMDVNYGSALKTYLLDKVDLIRIHRFDPEEVQFDDALVSSAVVWFRKARPGRPKDPEFTFGGTIRSPRVRRRIPRGELAAERKWTRFPAARTATARDELTLADLFTIKRGIATGANDFFLMDADKVKASGIPPKFLVPILPSPRYLQDDIVLADNLGRPKLEHALWLFDCHVPLSELETADPETAAYVRLGESEGIHQRYLTSRRQPWYSQEQRRPSPFLCTYMGRPQPGEAPFRLILNYSRAIATNVYLMLYPKAPLRTLVLQDPTVRRDVWEALQATVAETWSASGRVYGGGLHKVEPSELGRLPASRVVACVPDLAGSLSHQLALL